MPVHDWTRVNAGIFHHFHQRWIGAISDSLNAGLLPPPYYALAEQVAGSGNPDVLALEAPEEPPDGLGAAGTGLAVSAIPPPVRFVARTEMDQYALKQDHVIIRHSSGDRIVALVEVVSPGNKASRHALRTFVEKAAGALYRGYHLLIIDLLPPGRRDPNGIHGAIWDEISPDSFAAPPDKPLTLAAYSAGAVKTAYVEPVAVGDRLPDMPLFLDPETYVPVPLEATYQAAWASVPRRWQRVLEASAP
jgi:hypothetical protein